MSKEIVPRKKIVKDWLAVKTFVVMIAVTGVTSRVKQHNEEVLEKLKQEQTNFILSTWHQNIYFSTWLLRKLDLNALVSSSKDGEYMFRVMQHFGFNAVRGSTTRGGSKAILQMVKTLRGPTPVAITPDGPLGPQYKVQPGIIQLAKITGVPIIPWHYEVTSKWFLKTWDRHIMPKPFTQAVSAYGNPFYVPRDVSNDAIPEYCDMLEKIMLDLMDVAKNKLE